jgi:putative DNA primase/helicase
LAFVASQGFTISEPLELDGKIHRFKLESDRHGERSGAYCVWPEGKSFDGKPHGWVQDHHEGGEKHFWQLFNRDNPPPRKKPTDEERAAARARREAEQKQESERRREALKAAWDIYQAARPIEEAPDHPYLLAKHVRPVGGFPFGNQWCGLRVSDMMSQNGNLMRGLLLIPMMDMVTGRFHALHRVFGRPGPDGKFGKGWCSPAGGVFPIGVDVSRGPVVVAEGIATALALYDYFTDELNERGTTVIATMDAGNFCRQAPWIRARYANQELFAAVDDDDAGRKVAAECRAAGFNGIMSPPLVYGEVV